MGIASLVLGIIAVVFCWIPILNVLSLILGFVGLVLGAVGIGVGKKKGQPIGCAIAGLVMSIISIAIYLIWVVILAAAFAA